MKVLNNIFTFLFVVFIRPCSAISSESDCRSRGPEFDPDLAPYFRGDWLWNNFYGHSPPSPVSRRVVVSYKRNYVQVVLVNRLVKLVRGKKCGSVNWHSRHDHSWWLGCKTSNQILLYILVNWCQNFNFFTSENTMASHLFNQLWACPVLSLYSKPCYNIDLDITQSCYCSQVSLLSSFAKELYENDRTQGSHRFEKYLNI